MSNATKRRARVVVIGIGEKNSEGKRETKAQTEAIKLMQTSTSDDERRGYNWCTVVPGARLFILRCTLTNPLKLMRSFTKHDGPRNEINKEGRRRGRRKEKPAGNVFVQYRRRFVLKVDGVVSIRGVDTLQLQIVRGSRWTILAVTCNGRGNWYFTWITLLLWPR